MLEEVKYVGGNAATLLNWMSESFARRNLGGVVLAGAWLLESDLTNSDLSGAFLNDADIVRTCLNGVRCIGTSFRNGILANTSLEQAVFEGADFTDATLEYARPIFTISYSPDGLRIASGGDSKKITIWDSRTGREILCCEGHNGSVQTVVFSQFRDFLASGGGDGYVRVWDTLTGNEIWSKKLHKDFVRGLSYDSTGQWLASVGEDGKLVIWEARTGEVHLNLQEPSPILCVSFSPNGDLLALGSRNGTLLLWDLRTGSEVGRWQAHETVLFLAYNADASLLISGGVDHTDHRRRLQVGGIKVWEAPPWRSKLSISLNTHTGGWLHGSVSPREPYVAGRTGDNDVAIWNYQTGEQVSLLKGHYATVYSTIVVHPICQAATNGVSWLR